MNPKVEIIIPVFNQVKFTEACLYSLYRNTDPRRFHLIVVDNASTDGTKEFLDSFKATLLSRGIDNMETIHNDENFGWCKGLNIGFRRMHRDSEYVLWCNNDVLFECDWLDKMISHFKPGIGAVGPVSNYVMGRQNVAYNHEHKEELSPYLIGFFLMFRREVIDIVGDVDERFWPGGSEEYDYIIRMKSQLGLNCMIARDVYIHHFGSKTLLPFVGNSSKGYNDFIKERDTKLREKWGDEVIGQFLNYADKLLMVGIPHPGMVHYKFWKDTMWLAKPYGTYFYDVVRTSAIHDARNTLVEIALKENFKYLLFLDSDMRVPNNTIFRLMEHNKPIVAGYFFSRSGVHHPCAFRWSDDLKGLVSVFEPNSGLIEVDAVGMACTLIDTRVFRDLENPWFEWGKYNDATGKREYFGEDIAFCLKAREKGYKIFVDTDLVIRHIPMFDEKEIGPEDYKQEVR